MLKEEMALAPGPLGYFGRPGSFSHLAALKRFPQADLRECPTVEEAFSGLQARTFTHILVPIENASSGTITNTADQLMRLAKSDDGAMLQIREALAMRIRLVLMAQPGTTDIKKIYSHPAPFDHSRDWLARHYPGVELIPVTSTADAAALAAREKNTAAIGGHQIVAAHGLVVVNPRVGSEVANQTTFIIVGAPLPRPLRPTHLTLVFELPHVAGSLVAILQVLSRRQLNLTKILSRPIPGRFQEYRFMIEFQGKTSDQKVHDALNRLKKLTTFLACVGCYPIRNI